MPLNKRLKKALAWLVMFILGRAFQSASRWDPTVRHEAARWPEGFKVLMKVPKGPAMALVKEKGRIKYKGSRVDHPDLTITYKNIEGAFMIFTTQMGAEVGFAQHRMSVKGDLAKAMSFIRCVKMLQDYLFPPFLSKRVLKRVPRFGLKEHAVRLVIYTVGIPLGI